MTSHLLDPFHFPLHGSRLIEASAGTGKTWTIAALYLRLVLGHGGADGFCRPLLPAEILVMTFTRAATRELSNRVRERLLEAAAYFRDPAATQDSYLNALRADHPDPGEQQRAAHRLMLAAETMDEAAIFTIDAWCQRMLREHAFDSASLFDEELVSDEQALFDDAAHDYWRQQVYPLGQAPLTALLACWPDVVLMKRAVRELVSRAALLGAQPGAQPDEALAVLISRVQASVKRQLSRLKDGWLERVQRMEQWIAHQREAAPKCFNGNKMRPESLLQWFAGLRAWALAPGQVLPDISATAWSRLTREGIENAFAKGFQVEVPDDFGATLALQQGLAELESLDHALCRHAASAIAQRMDELKRRAHQFGFADMPQRLNHALQGQNGAALRQRITLQYPVALVDEFQDTAPGQYQILDLLYRVADNQRALGLFLIGDPKQSIYGFRGADMHSYLAARIATGERHYQLGTNYRSSVALVAAVNRLFLHAEGDVGSAGFSAGAFRFRKNGVNPLPFVAVAAQGRAQELVAQQGLLSAMTVAVSTDEHLKGDAYREFFARHCAEQIVLLLNDAQAGFAGAAGFQRLQPADIAVLVRDRREAGAMRRALQQRQVASVYLSDKDSVIDSAEAQDLLRWLMALASPLDGSLARAAFATRTIGLPLAELALWSSDELEWEQRVEQLKALHLVWQRQGVLAMLRRFIHELQLPAALLRQAGGERRLTNLLHLAELLQAASRLLDGEQALIRWLAEQIEGQGQGGDERVLRLESDAELVQVITVHKAKGLEYPLVFLPFAVTARKAERRNRSFLEFNDASGARQIDLSLSDLALAAVEAARIEEDVRLLYVALTRACHYLWLGVAALASRKAGENSLHESALGYLLTGGAPLPAAQLPERWGQVRGDCGAIEITQLGQQEQMTLLARTLARPPLIEAARFDAHFERDWAVGSFTSLTRQLANLGSSGTVRAPRLAQEETLREDDALELDASALATSSQMQLDAARHGIDGAPWHSFPRGSVPGNFLHEQLEWMGREGFAMASDEQFEQRLGMRCERAGWGHRRLETVLWLRTVAGMMLPMLGVALSQIASLLPEMEFWFPSERLDTLALDRLCSRHLLGAVARPALPQRQLHGMLKGFSDLVFEHAGRYWIVDYKSTYLGPNDGAYHEPALVQAMAQHRYDIQGAIYMLALHRLLKSRLGASYDPAQHLGGAVFLFLRGIANPGTRGCHWLKAQPELLDGLDALFNNQLEAHGS